MAHTKKPKDKTKNKRVSYKEKLKLKKKESKKNKHRARLIVRNLPFATTEENFREHFEKFGEVDEIKLLKKEDGKLLGCGFVQFKLRQKAAKAIHHLNGKLFLDRKIDCNWALPKDKFVKEHNEAEVKVKEEPPDKGYEASVKKENDEMVNTSENVEVKVEEEKVSENDDSSDDEDVEEKTKDDDEDVEEKTNDDDEDVEEKTKDDKVEEESYLDVEIKDEEDDINHIEDESTETKKPHVISNDASEGKTIFIKNVPFTATNEDIRSTFAQFGPMYYALVCMDPLTEHSKGTAFVKFKSNKDADECLATPQINLMGNTLECMYALTKDDLTNKSSKDKNSKQRDSRNLYLVKEGVVVAGSKAAEGVSTSDMAKRLQLEQYKSQVLKNLNMIVARTRLIVHNIPASWDDNKLRTLFKKHSDPKATIKEAKIMRNMRLCDGRGVGKSKEFGFVTFTAHEAALHALRAINNNPTIFSENKRPIVAFSIENRAKLNTKQKRLENSKIKNPNYKNYDPTKFKAKHEERRGTKRSLEVETIHERQNKFTGVTAVPGNKKMRSKFNLKTQAKLHFEQLKKDKKKKKFVKKTLQQKQEEFTKQPRQKINKNKAKISDNFSKLVNDYKQKLLSSSESGTLKKKKWFE